MHTSHGRHCRGPLPALMVFLAALVVSPRVAAQPGEAPGPPGSEAPTGTPPADTPPTDTPPADTPPTDTPPADTPPADTPPTDTPPAKPPADKPPADKPPADKPPADKPPTDTPEGEQTGEEKQFVQGGELRRVNDHNFISPMGFPTAFLNTSVGFTQGVGSYLFEAPNITVDLDNNNVPQMVAGKETTHSMLFYGQGFFGQIGIVNWVAIDLYLRGTAAIGGELDTVMIAGALASLRAGGMVKVRLFTLEDIGMQMALGLGATYDRTIRLVPIQLIANLADLEASTDKVIAQAEELNLRPALMLAEGVGPFGVQIAFAPGFGVTGSVPEGDYESSQQIKPGIQMELDFYELTEYLPGGIVVAYDPDFWFGGGKYVDGGIDHNVTAGLYYTGRRDLELGLVFNGTWGEPPNDSTTYQIYSGQLLIGYFF